MILIVAGIYVAHSHRLTDCLVGTDSVWKVDNVKNAWVAQRLVGNTLILSYEFFSLAIIPKITHDYIYLLCYYFQTLKGNEKVLSTTLPTRATSEVSSTSSIHADWNAKQDHRQTQKLKGRFC